MSTIAADNAKPSAGGTSTDLISGLAKVWAKADGITTTTLEDSINVSSITDLTTGSTQFNITNNMSSGDYSVQGSSALSGAISWTDLGADSVVVAASFNVYTRNGSTTLTDADYISGSALGDLA